MHDALTRFSRLRTLVEEYREDDHPRGPGGKWAPKGGSPAAVAPEKRAAERAKSKAGKAVAKSLRRAYDYDWEKADVPSLKGLTDRVLKAGGKADICLVNPPLCRGTLGVERADMPQLDKDAWARLVDSAKKDGVGFAETEISPGELKATQGEINAVKVLGMAEAMKAGKTLGGGNPIVSSDGYVLDGHHRWAASWLTGRGAKMKVTRVDLPIRKLLDYSERFSSAKKGFYEAVERAVRYMTA